MPQSAFAPSAPRRLAGALAVLSLGLGLAPAAQAATVNNFQLKTTSDFIALCDTKPGEENYVAAVHFCHGFVAGAYQYYYQLAAHDPAERYVCLPDPPPSRETAKAGFLAWTRSNPATLQEAPVDSIFRYLAQTYPCPATAAKP